MFISFFFYQVCFHPDVLFFWANCNQRWVVMKTASNVNRKSFLPELCLHPVPAPTTFSSGLDARKQTWCFTSASLWQRVASSSPPLWSRCYYPGVCTSHIFDRGSVFGLERKPPAACGHRVFHCSDPQQPLIARHIWLRFDGVEVRSLSKYCIYGTVWKQIAPPSCCFPVTLPT